MGISMVCVCVVLVIVMIVTIHPLGLSLRLDAVQRSTESTRLSVESMLLRIILDYDLFWRGEVWKPILPKRQV